MNLRENNKSEKKWDWIFLMDGTFTMYLKASSTGEKALR